MNYNQLAEYFAQVMQEIHERVGNAKNLTNDKNAQTLITAILKSLDDLGIKVVEVMPKELERTYRKALGAATKDLVEQGVKVENIQSDVLLKRKLHIAALTSLVRETLQDLKTAIHTAKINATTTVKKLLKQVKQEIAKGLIKGNSNKVVTKRLAKAFQEEGLIAFITAPDKNGVQRQLRLDKYARIVVSYKMREASTQGAVNRYQESGVHMIRISQHSDSCAKCAQYAGKVMSLNGEQGFPSAKNVPLPPYHPHCRHTVSSYVLEYKTDQEIQKEKDKWEGFKEGKDIRTDAQKRAYAKEQTIRRKAHEELKQYERYKAVLGDEMYKTIGAFRRAKRGNSNSWKEMQLKYRRMNRELKME